MEDSGDPVLIGRDTRKMLNALSYMVDLAKPRLVMGAIRYGTKPRPYSHIIAMMYNKINTYNRTGNMEMLVDLFNLCAVESELKTHPKHHFEVIDRV